MNSVKRLLPYDVKNALIEVCGRGFWYKRPLFETFDRAGIPEDYYLKYEHESKFTIVRCLLDDLERMDDHGFLLQRRLVTELNKFKNLPDPAVKNRNAGIQALREFKEAVQKHDFSLYKETISASKSAFDIEKRAKNISNRKNRLMDLYQLFQNLSSSNDRQDRGYKLEELLCELFSIYEIDYRKSYRCDGEQIDGSFSFDGFGYIVESRWREKKPTLGELAEILVKIDRKIASTRGLVVSMAGFDCKVLQRLCESGPSKLVLMDGVDLTLILEDRVSLLDALKEKIDRATQEGVMFFPLRQMLSQELFH